jgi:hypothetical protein
MGTRIPVYQSPGQFAYWLVALEDDVRLVTPHGDSMECGGIVPYVLILKLNRGVWEEVYNWEDGVRKILKDNNLPEEV